MKDLSIYINDFFRHVPKRPVTDSEFQQILSITETEKKYPKTEESSLEQISVSIHPPIFVGKTESPSHYHDFFEIVYVYRGAYFHKINGNLIPQKAGQIMLLNLHTSHATWNESIDDIIFNIMVSRQVIEQTFLQLLKNNLTFFNFYLDAIYGISKNYQYMMFQYTEKLSQILSDIIEECMEQPPFYQQMAVAELLRMFVELSRIEAVNPLPKPEGKTDPKQQKIYDILSYMKDHYSEVTLESMANHFHYTPRHISRLIKENSGKTFIQLVNQYKIANAGIYLKNSNFSVEEIMQITGFHDTSYFYRLFKRITGVSVTKFRQTALNEKKNLL